MSSNKNLLDRLLKESPYARIAFVVGIASILLIAGLATVGQPKAASADKQKVEEFFGIASRTVSAVRVVTQLSDCGDGFVDANGDGIDDTRIIRNRSDGTVTWTGIIEGTATLDSNAIIDSCVAGNTHGSFRITDTFEEVTIKPDPSDPSTWRTGGLVIELAGSFRNPTPGVSPANSITRSLCGTGELRGIHLDAAGAATGTPTSAAGFSVVWVHFGHNHDVGYDFLCEGLDG
ncbi:MAG: hypothetical protein HYU02_00980 [Thaumarchaeota archaeon]|nr:hypothetical protein [Nitrososphaerota archaeon]